MKTFWQCPQCGAILIKKAKTIELADRVGALVGSVTCKTCGGQTAIAGVYAGAFDFADSDETIAEMGRAAGEARFDRIRMRWVYRNRVLRLQSDVEPAGGSSVASASVQDEIHAVGHPLQGAKPFLCRIGFHKRTQCVCVRCGQEMHSLADNKCSVCGRRRCPDCGSFAELAKIHDPQERDANTECVCGKCGKEMHSLVDNKCSVCGHGRCHDCGAFAELVRVQDPQERDAHGVYHDVRIVSVCSACERKRPMVLMF